MNHANPKRARTGSIELEYEEVGSGGRPFLLVHGFTGSRDDFREQLPELSRYGHTVAVDQRGHGGSDNPGAGYTLEQLSADLLGFLDAVGIERCDLLGHSMGGMVALRFTLAHPARVASLVLMDTAPGPLDLPARKWFEVGGQIARSQGMESLFSLMRKVAEKESRRPDPVLRSMERMGEDVYWSRIEAKIHAMDPAAFGDLGAVLAEHDDVTGRLGEIACPTLIVVGEQDVPFRKSSDAMERGIPGARQIVIPDAVHSPQLENPEAWLEAITSHLAAARKR
jgi:pimeloyl-ACP methyl ester carboxylesterase